MSTMTEYYTTVEAAKWLGCNDRRIRQLAQQNKLAGAIKKQKWYIPIATVEKMLIDAKNGLKIDSISQSSVARSAEERV